MPSQRIFTHTHTHTHFKPASRHTHNEWRSVSWERIDRYNGGCGPHVLCGRKCTSALTFCRLPIFILRNVASAEGKNDGSSNYEILHILWHRLNTFKSAKIWIKGALWKWTWECCDVASSSYGLFLLDDQPRRGNPGFSYGDNHPFFNVFFSNLTSKACL